jgi:hypothetical protein
LDGFTSSGTGSDLSCIQADNESKTRPVLITFSIQSAWTAIPALTDGRRDNQDNFGQGVVVDIAAALRISPKRLKWISIVPDPLPADSSAKRSTGMYVLVSVEIGPSTAMMDSDTARDAAGQPYSPNALAQILETELQTAGSPIYSGAVTTYARYSTNFTITRLTDLGSGETSSSSTALIVAICAFVGAGILVLVIVILLSKYSPSTARVFDLATVIMAYANVVTDIIFIKFLSDNLDMYNFRSQLYAAIVFFLLPIVFNIGMSSWYVVDLLFSTKGKALQEHPCGKQRISERDPKRWAKVKDDNPRDEEDGPKKTFRDWFEDPKHLTVALIIWLSSFISVDCLALYTCQVLWLPHFSAPWPGCEKLVLVLGLVDVLVKDLPHLIIQITTTQATNEWGALQVLSIASSAAAIFFGVFKRGIVLALRLRRFRTAPLQDAPLAHLTTTGDEAPVQETNSLEDSPPGRAAIRTRKGPASGVQLPTVLTVLAVLCCSAPIHPCAAWIADGPQGHIVSSNLVMNGNITLLDPVGGSSNLLLLLQQQQATLLQQQQLMQQQALTIARLNSTLTATQTAVAAAVQQFSASQEQVDALNQRITTLENNRGVWISPVQGAASFSASVSFVDFPALSVFSVPATGTWFLQANVRMTTCAANQCAAAFTYRVCFNQHMR